MGGNTDTSGHIRKETILEIMRDEFELAVDLEEMMERIEISTDNLDFESFKRLFKTSDDPRTLSKASSVLSVDIEIN